MIAFVLADCRKIRYKPNFCPVSRNSTLGPNQRITLNEVLGFKNPSATFFYIKLLINLWIDFQNTF